MCMQVLDASLGLLPLADLVGTLHNLLGRTDNSVRILLVASIRADEK